jgi:hypothetical protein
MSAASSTWQDARRVYRSAIKHKGNQGTFLDFLLVPLKPNLVGLFCFASTLALDSAWYPWFFYFKASCGLFFTD